MDTEVSRESAAFWKNEKLPHMQNHSRTDKIAKSEFPGNSKYEANVQHPAGTVFQPKDFITGTVTAIIPGCAWVVPNMLTKEECAEWIECGKSAGLESASKHTLRTNTRTSYYMDARMSAQLKTRFPKELINLLEESTPGTEVREIHDNWKIARYEKGQSFPAHYDQDSYQNLPPNKNGIKVSKHYCI